MPLVSYIEDKKRRLKRQRIKVTLLKYFNIKLPIPDKNNHISQLAYVLKTEEKGSDVNLGSHLVADAYEKKFDVGVVISNDSDLAGPIRIVNNKLNLPTVLLSPVSRSKTNKKLSKASQGKVKPIRKNAIQASQFPKIITDKVGQFTKPLAW